MQCSAIEVQRGRWADRKESKDDILKLYLVDQIVICLFDMNMNIIVARDQGAEDSRTEEEKDRSCVNAAAILEALLLIVSATERYDRRRKAGSLALSILPFAILLIYQNFLRYRAIILVSRFAQDPKFSPILGHC